MDVPEELIKSFEADKSVRLRFKGKDDEEAVLVSENRTYSVRRGETSNTQLLLSCSTCELFDSSKSGDDCTDIVFSTGYTLELAPAPARLKSLPELLARCPYEGPDLDDDDEVLNNRPTIEYLDQQLQASRVEIISELQSLGALCIDGRYCLLAQKYESALITEVFSACERHDWWTLGGVSLPILSSDRQLRAYPTSVLHNFLNKYTIANITPPPAGPASPPPHPVATCSSSPRTPPPPTDSAAAPLSPLDLPKLALARADELLVALGPGGAAGGARLSVDDFLAAWAAMLPPRAAGEARLDRLRGRAVSEPHAGGGRPLLRPLPAASLPADPRARLRALFAIAPAWTRDDLVAFLADVAGPAPGAADQLLLRHTRVTRSGPPGAETRLHSARI